MNKISLLFLSLICMLQSVNSDSISVSVQPVKSSSQIILKSDRSKSKIFMIQFPLTYRVCNLSSEKAALYYYRYYFNSADKSHTAKLGWIGQGMLILKKADGKLENPYNSGRIVIDSHHCNEYITYTYHHIGKQGNYQELFLPYLEKMKEENKDTLNIGTFEEIRQIYPNLFEDFLKGDSVEFHFWKIYKEGMDKHIILPVEFL